MPGLLGNPPGILTPGKGPNGPGPIDSRRSETSVGWKSSCPYGATGVYPNSNGVMGFIGPSADALRKPTLWYCRIGGSNDNGGSSTSLTAERTGTDGATTANASTFTSASAAFTNADIGKGVCVGTGASAYRYRITAITSATVAVVDRPTVSNLASQAWAIGGAWADLRAAVGDAAVSANLVGAGSAVNAGDTVYLGGGTYRAVVLLGNAWATTIVGTTTVSINLPQFNGTVNITGDTAGQFTGDSGMVQITAYTTNDKTAPSGSVLLTMSGHSNISFRNIMFVGGTASPSVLSMASSEQNDSFVDCSFHFMTSPNSTSLSISGTVVGGIGLARGHLFDRCFFFRAAPVFSLPTSAADYDANITVRNSIFIYFNPAIDVTATGALAGKGGGVRYRNCFVSAGNPAARTNSANLSTVFPCQIYNCEIFGVPGGTGISANASGQIVEDYNIVVATTARANVTAGTHSISDSSYSPLFHMGQERIWGGLLRPFGEPMSGSPLLGFGSDGGQTAYDLYNRPRPAGGGSLPASAVGALERGNTPSQATSPAPPSGTYDWQGTGPWYQDFLLPVSNTSTTISIVVQRDAAYDAAQGMGNPAMLILANGILGITAQTLVDSGAAAQWNTLTSSAFTPSGNGWVTVRIASYDGSGTSVVSFANISVT